jgi:hypothetical protein
MGFAVLATENYITYTAAAIAQHCAAAADVLGD